MVKKNIQINLGTFLNFILALVFVVAAAMIVFLVNYNMRKQALMEAESKARIILDLNLATHTYFSQQLKPKVFKVTDTLRSDDYFEPTWMSSTYAIREIYKYFISFRKIDYYYKECAINARSPENEADADEKAFLDEVYFLTRGKATLDFDEIDVKKLSIKRLKNYSKPFPPYVKSQIEDILSKR